MPEHVPAQITPPVGQWFTDTRVARTGEICAELLLKPSDWIERRKDSVTIVDDTVVRWQTSVDFELPPGSRPLERSWNGRGQELYCAPLFVLPKRPSYYMSFNLIDESGRSLSLTSRAENARISSAIICAMAGRVLGESLTSAMTNELNTVACSETLAGKERANRLLEPIAGDTLDPQWAQLAQHPRFGWWLRAVADGSIVVVPYRASPGQRKGIKLSYMSQFPTQLNAQVRLGWKPYEMVLDQPFVEARSYHLEAEAPAGLRIESAGFIDDRPAAVPITDGGLKRRVHLYQRDSSAAGAGTTTMSLRASADGFLTGAWLSGALVTGALAVCDCSARAIAENPTSAPALLLFLPGLLASYVGRPDRHALTSRLLSAVRNLVLLCALVAYCAGIVVALAGKTSNDMIVVNSRVDHLQFWLTIATGIAGFASLLMFVSWTRSHPWMREITQAETLRSLPRRIRARQLAVFKVIRATPVSALAGLYGQTDCVLTVRQGDEELDETYAELKPVLSPHLRVIRRTRLAGTWTFYLYASDDPGGALATVRAILRPRFFLRPVSGLFVRREKNRCAAGLDVLAVPPRTAGGLPSDPTHTSR